MRHLRFLFLIMVGLQFLKLPSKNNLSLANQLGIYGRLTALCFINCIQCSQRIEIRKKASQKPLTLQKIYGTIIMTENRFIGGF